MGRLVQRPGEPDDPAAAGCLPVLRRRPVALLGDDDGADSTAIGAPLPEPGEEAAAALQSAVDDFIDSCVEYRLLAPRGCPFVSDGQVDTTDRRRVDEVRDPVWTVDEYPVATVVPGSGVYGEPVLLVEFTEPGRLTLQGTATEDWGVWEPFTAACRFGGTAPRPGRSRRLDPDRAPGRAGGRDVQGHRMKARPVMALLDWARPRRWSILVEAVLAAVVALAAWPIAVIGNNEPAAVDVVTAYLEALREGDVERAETFVSDSFGWTPTGRG